MPDYKLTYFDARGRAEFIRQLFKLADVLFVDNRITIKEWPGLKSNTPFGKVPVLEVDGEQLPQTIAIARFVGRQFGFAGKTPFEEAWVDALAYQAKEYFEELDPLVVAVLKREAQGEEEKRRVEAAEPAREKFFSLIEKRLRASKSGFLVGNSVTWIDLLLADQVDITAAILKGFLDAYPASPHTLHVLAHRDRIYALPKIKEWIAARPKQHL